METRNETTMLQKDKEQRSSTVKRVTEHFLHTLERTEQMEERVLDKMIVKEKAEKAKEAK
ncbi:MAG: hypothetical protein U0L33_05930 [Acutalibacteraceae bacterium]|nr:hypothetical protein [Acutalibacteraceae bacterium]